MLLWSDHYKIDKYYKGELCSYMGYQDNCRFIVLVSYISACIFKISFVENYWQIYINIDSKIKNQTIKETLHQLYMDFFMNRLRDVSYLSTCSSYKQHDLQVEQTYSVVYWYQFVICAFVLSIGITN